MSFFSAVLFDMDGTLVDSEPLWLANEISVMRKYGLNGLKQISGIA